jgi:predicted esterase YcpF (UPF0227 family)
MIVNIHGFRGEGNNSKYRWLCENTPRHAIYSPTFHYVNENPYSILDHLVNNIASYFRENPDNPMGVYVVGSSLGGFFARCINQIYPEVTAILINPLLVPFLHLREYLQIHQCQAYLDLLARYAYEDKHGSQDNLHVFIGDSDEVIDHEKMTKPLLPFEFHQIYTIQGGTHRLEITPEVENILKSIMRLPEGMSVGVRRNS